MIIFPGQFFILKQRIPISSNIQMRNKDFCTFAVGTCGIVITMSSVEMRQLQWTCCVLINNCLFYPPIWLLEESII